MHRLGVALKPMLSPDLSPSKEARPSCFESLDVYGALDVGWSEKDFRLQSSLEYQREAYLDHPQPDPSLIKVASWHIDLQENK
jgi:hypothetical protein